MALEKIEGYLVRCDKCGAYLGDETDWVLQVYEVLDECKQKEWEIIGEDYLIHLCPKCK